MDLYVGDFLRRFQTLEDLIKSQPGLRDETTFRDALLHASRNNEYLEKNFALIEDLYSLRNVFSHRNRGKYVAKINKFALDNLEKIISELKNPPTVVSKFGVDVFQVDLGYGIDQAMEVMHSKTYTHIPIWDGNNLAGVFSYTSFFEWLAERLKSDPNPTFTKRIMSDIDRKYLNSPTVNYDFMKEETSVYEVAPTWDKYTKQQKRLDCVLITKNGKKDEKITGIITSWDLGAI